MVTISTHVLDTSTGAPAAGISVVLEWVGDGGASLEISRAATNDDGRAVSLNPENAVLNPGHYRLTFGAGAYFGSREEPTFYRDIAIDFVVDADRHYHVPLLLSPFGYSTYRGS